MAAVRYTINNAKKFLEVGIVGRAETADVAAFPFCLTDPLSLLHCFT